MKMETIEEKVNCVSWFEELSVIALKSKFTVHSMTPTLHKAQLMIG